MSRRRVGGYRVSLSDGRHTREVGIAGVTAIGTFETRRAVRALAGADVIVTAVGATNLPAYALELLPIHVALEPLVANLDAHPERECRAGDTCGFAIFRIQIQQGEHTQRFGIVVRSPPEFRCRGS